METTTTTVFRIAKWTTVFERAESRKLKQLNWISIPISFSSSGYQLLLDEFEDDAPAIYGAWCVLTSLSATCSVRGVLANSRGNPLKISHIARMTGFPAAVFEKLIAWASTEEVGWLEQVPDEELSAMFEKPNENNGQNESPDTPGESPDDSPTIPRAQDITGPNQTGQNPTKPDKQLAAAKSSGGVLDFSALEGTGRVSEAATRLADAVQRRRIHGIDSEWIWQHAAVGELAKPGFIASAASKILERHVTKPRAYIEKILREECPAVLGMPLATAVLHVPARASPANGAKA